MANASDTADTVLRELKNLLHGPYDSLDDGQERVDLSTGPVLFLGSGFSMFLSEGANLPIGWQLGWGQLLDDLADPEQLEYGLQLKQLIASTPPGTSFEDKFESAERLDSNEFWKGIRNRFYKQDMTLDGITKELKTRNPKRWKLACALTSKCNGIVTTNYDPIALALVRQVCVDTGHRFQCVVLDKQSSIPENLVYELLSTHETTTLVYLHGSLVDGETLPAIDADADTRLRKIVLTASSYREAYLDREQTIAQDNGTPHLQNLTRCELISRLSTKGSLIFLGFSFSDYLIKICMLTPVSSGSKECSQQHFAILNLEPVKYGDDWLVGHEQPKRNHSEQWLMRYGVNPIFLDGLYGVYKKRFTIAEALQVALEQLELMDGEI